MYRYNTIQVQTMSQLFAGVCVTGFVRGLFMSGRFCPGWFLSVPVLSECICYIRKLNITLHFMFRIHDKKMYKCDVTCSLPPSPVTNCHLLGPPPPSSMTYFMDGPLVFIIDFSLPSDNFLIIYL